jgi:hypothetical protein
VTLLKEGITIYHMRYRLMILQLATFRSVLMRWKQQIPEKMNIEIAQIPLILTTTPQSQRLP